jgi:hypothetical protein
LLNRPQKSALQVDNPPADLAASLRPSQQNGEDAAYGVGISQSPTGSFSTIIMSETPLRPIPSSNGERHNTSDVFADAPPAPSFRQNYPPASRDGSACNGPGMSRSAAAASSCSLRRQYTIIEITTMAPTTASASANGRANSSTPLPR